MSRILLNNEPLKADLSNVNVSALTTIVQQVAPSTSVANVGTGEGGVYRDTSGGTVNLKTIKQGAGVTVTNNADDITLSSSGGGLAYQGTWDASTNTPVLASGVGTAGHYYIVSVAGTTSLDGISSWAAKDWAVFSDTGVWQKIDNTNDEPIPASQVNFNCVMGFEGQYGTVQKCHNSMSAGVIDGFSITDGGAGTINVSSGSGYIRATDSTLSDLLCFTLGATTGVALTDNQNNYVYISYNAGTPTVVVLTNKSNDFNTVVLLGQVYRAGTTLTIDTTIKHHVDAAHSEMNQRFYGLGQFIPEQKKLPLIADAGGRQFTVSQATWWSGLTQIITSAFNSGVDFFDAYYRNGVGGWTVELSQTVIENTLYDNGSGTLAVAQNNRYIVRWILESKAGKVYMIYGTAQYSTIVDAQGEAPPSTFPPSIDPFVVVIGRIVIQKNATSFALITSAFSGLFTGTSFSAGDISYDNTTSGLVASNVQDALDEIDAVVDLKVSSVSGTANSVAVTAGINPVVNVPKITTNRVDISDSLTGVSVRDSSGFTVYDGAQVRLRVPTTTSGSVGFENYTSTMTIPFGNNSTDRLDVVGIRFNVTDQEFEGYTGTVWRKLDAQGTISSITATNSSLTVGGTATDPTISAPKLATANTVVVSDDSVWKVVDSGSSLQVTSGTTILFALPDALSNTIAGFNSLNPYKGAVFLCSGNNSTERPSVPVEGCIRYNNTDKTFEWWNGSSWAKPSTFDASIGPVIIGPTASAPNGSVHTIAIGSNTCGANSVNADVCIGGLCKGGGGGFSVGIGYGAMSNAVSGGRGVVAIGESSGVNNPGGRSVHLGPNAGTGGITRGLYSINIGYLAGNTHYHQSCIILNASGVALDSSQSNSFYVKPIRSLLTNTQKLTYNTTSGEITTTNDCITDDGSSISVYNSSRTQKFVLDNVATNGTLGCVGTTATGAFSIPSGTTETRPTTPKLGSIRWSTSFNSLEVYDGSNWRLIQMV